MKFALQFLLIFNLFNSQQLKLFHLKEKGNVLICDSIKINGRFVSGKLIFDTGSTKTLLDVGTLDIENYRRKETINTYYGQLSFRNIRLNSLEIGNLREEKIEVRFIDIKKILGSCNPENIIGIIGMDIIKKYNWKLNLKNNELLYSNSAFNNDGYSIYPINFKHNGGKFFGSDKKPTFSLKINDINTDFIIDTGSFDIISVNKKNQKIPKIKLLEMQNSYGNIISEEYIAKGKIYIIDKEVDLPIKYSDHLLTSIGAGFLKNFEVIFDEGFKNIYLKKHEDFKTDVDIKMNFGFSIEKFYNNIRVSNVYKNSLADKSGLKVLDEIASINGINLEQYDLCTDAQNIVAQFEKSQMIIRLKNDKIINIVQ